MIVKMDHISIQTVDFDGAIRFYSDLLGLAVCTPPFEYKGRQLCYLDAGNMRIELYSVKESGGTYLNYTNNRCGLDHLAFTTPNLERLIDLLMHSGIKIIKPPFTLTTQAGVSRLAFVEGPDSQEIELRQESVALDG